VDGAGKVAGEVGAWRSRRFVDGEVRRAGEAEGGTAERKTAGAIRAKGW